MEDWCWVIEYQKKLVGYTFRIRRSDSTSVLPSAITIHGDGCWALTLDRVKSKALKEIDQLNRNENWKILGETIG